MNAPTNQPSTGRLILIPALITLGVTLARLIGELSHAPDWLASSAPGGGGALLGIAWLAPVFGIYFATRLAGVERPYRSLAKTLIAYGYAARIPVFVVTVLAIMGQWGTHYEKFGGDPSQQPSFWTKVGLTALFQLIGWVFVWTLGSGMLTGGLTLLLLRRRRVAVQPT